MTDEQLEAALAAAKKADGAPLRVIVRAAIEAYEAVKEKEEKPINLGEGIER